MSKDESNDAYGSLKGERKPVIRRDEGKGIKKAADAGSNKDVRAT